MPWILKPQADLDRAWKNLKIQPYPEVGLIQEKLPKGVWSWYPQFRKVGDFQAEKFSVLG